MGIRLEKLPAPFFVLGLSERYHEASEGGGVTGRACFLFAFMAFAHALRRFSSHSDERPLDCDKLFYLDGYLLHGFIIGAGCSTLGQENLV